MYLTSGKAVEIVNTTVMDNVSGMGAVYMDHPGAIGNSTIVGNRLNGFQRLQSSVTGKVGDVLSTGHLRIQNSIFADNAATNCIAAGTEGRIESLGHNLDGQSGCGFTMPGDLINTNPKLLRLTDGFMLNADSPARDAADNSGCKPLDQIGGLRQIGGVGGDRCDIGAPEMQ